MASQPTERPVDLMIDLRERMVRIETKLDLRAVKDEEIDTDIAALKARATALETQGTIQRTQIATLRWVGGGAIAVILFLKDLIPLFAH